MIPEKRFLDLAASMKSLREAVIENIDGSLRRCLKLPMTPYCIQVSGEEINSTFFDLAVVALLLLPPGFILNMIFFFNSCRIDPPRPFFPFAYVTLYVQYMQFV